MKNILNRMGKEKVEILKSNKKQPGILQQTWDL